MIKEKTPVVTHLTRVGLSLLPDTDVFQALPVVGQPTPEVIRSIGRTMAVRAERVAAMMELMAAQGFSFESDKRAIYAYSNEVEAFQIKRDLIRAGFADYEFQIYLEYTRGWGML